MKEKSIVVAGPVACVGKDRFCREINKRKEAIFGGPFDAGQIIYTPNVGEALDRLLYAMYCEGYMARNAELCEDHLRGLVDTLAMVKEE